MTHDYASKTTEELKALLSNYEEQMCAAGHLTCATIRVLCLAIKAIFEEIKKREANS